MKTSFGCSAAAIRLAEMVEKNPSARRWIGSILSDLGRLLHGLLLLPDKGSKRVIYPLVQKHFTERVDNSPKLTTQEATFLKNVIITRCRNFKKYADMPEISKR